MSVLVLRKSPANGCAPEIMINFRLGRLWA